MGEIDSRAHTGAKRRTYQACGRQTLYAHNLAHKFLALTGYLLCMVALLMYRFWLHTIPQDLSWLLADSPYSSFVKPEPTNLQQPPLDLQGAFGSPDNEQPDALPLFSPLGAEGQPLPLLMQAGAENPASGSAAPASVLPGSVPGASPQELHLTPAPGFFPVSDHSNALSVLDLATRVVTRCIACFKWLSVTTCS